ncbi:unnamed protein product [Cyprideis torosa]|uniref:carbonic anhydrase n=1 Tax=Cyprideis torosa TaxID=163714 RepID=A0A7R8WBX5_9CRUS|nr:unnamed protein product [Cyprideis torosa]CAG0886821.1 unnamed protein product [Cyprideis torosa]
MHWLEALEVGDSSSEEEIVGTRCPVVILLQDKIRRNLPDWLAETAWIINSDSLELCDAEALLCSVLPPPPRVPQPPMLLPLARNLALAHSHLQERVQIGESGRPVVDLSTASVAGVSLELWENLRDLIGDSSSEEEVVGTRCPVVILLQDEIRRNLPDWLAGTAWIINSDSLELCDAEALLCSVLLPPPRVPQPPMLLPLARNLALGHSHLQERVQIGQPVGYSDRLLLSSTMFSLFPLEKALGDGGESLSDLDWQKIRFYTEDVSYLNASSNHWDRRIVSVCLRELLTPSLLSIGDSASEKGPKKGDLLAAVHSDVLRFHREQEGVTLVRNRAKTSGFTELKLETFPPFDFLSGLVRSLIYSLLEALPTPLFNVATVRRKLGDEVTTIALEILSELNACNVLLTHVRDIVPIQQPLNNLVDPRITNTAAADPSFITLRRDTCTPLPDAPLPNDLCADRGNRQSPINIRTKEAFHTEFPSWNFEHYNRNREVVCVFNTGHTVEWILNTLDRPAISGGGLPGRYILEQFHIHWSTLSEGSEHLVDGNGFPLEFHLVHYHERFTNIHEALASKQLDAVAAIGVFVNVEHNAPPNPGLEQLMPHFSSIDNPGVMEVLNGSFHDLTFLLPGDRDKFYRYEGSLTSGQHYETLIWTVFEDPIIMSGKQAEGFRHLHNRQGAVIRRNNRPVQPRNGRLVLRNALGCELPSRRFKDRPDVIEIRTAGSQVEIPVEKTVEPAIYFNGVAGTTVGGVSNTTKNTQTFPDSPITYIPAIANGLLTGPPNLIAGDYKPPTVEAIEPINPRGGELVKFPDANVVQEKQKETEVEKHHYHHQPGLFGSTRGLGGHQQFVDLKNGGKFFIQFGKPKAGGKTDIQKDKILQQHPGPNVIDYKGQNAYGDTNANTMQGLIRRPKPSVKYSTGKGGLFNTGAIIDYLTLLKTAFDGGLWVDVTKDKNLVSLLQGNVPEKWITLSPWHCETSMSRELWLQLLVKTYQFLSHCVDEMPPSTVWVPALWHPEAFLAAFLSTRGGKEKIIGAEGMTLSLKPPSIDEGFRLSGLRLLGNATFSLSEESLNTSSEVLPPGSLPPLWAIAVPKDSLLRKRDELSLPLFGFQAVFPSPLVDESFWVLGGIRLGTKFVDDNGEAQNTDAEVPGKV